MKPKSDPCPRDEEQTAAGDEIPADPALTAEGWVRRFVAGEDRVEEATELYRSMGLEVRVEKLSPENFGSGCADCALASCRAYVMIYTRRRP